MVQNTLIPIIRSILRRQMGRVPTQRCKEVVSVEVVSRCNFYDANTPPTSGTQRHGAGDCIIVSAVIHIFIWLIFDYSNNFFIFDKLVY